MSSNLSHIEVEKEFIRKFFELAVIPTPKDLSPNDFNNALSRISKRIDPTKKIDIDENQSDLKESEIAFIKILIIDNVGFVMQRVKQQLLKKKYIMVETYNDVIKATEKIRRESYHFIILNILIPTEREGLLFLKDVKTSLSENKSETKLIVTGDSIRKELMAYLKKQGISNIIERKPDWITKLLDTVEKERATIE